MTYKSVYKVCKTLC